MSLADILMYKPTTKPRIERLCHPQYIHSWTRPQSVICLCTSQNQPCDFDDAIKIKEYLALYTFIAKLKLSNQKNTATLISATLDCRLILATHIYSHGCRAMIFNLVFIVK